MTGKQLERLIALFSPIGATHLDHLGRALRALGMMPSGGRGITAPKLDATHAANMLIAASLPGTPLEAARKVAEYRVAEASWSGIYSSMDAAHLGNAPPVEAFAGYATFGEAFDALLCHLVHEAPVHSVELVHEWPRAEVVLKDGRRFYYGFASLEDARAKGYRTYPIKTKTIIPVSALSQIAVDVQFPSSGPDDT